MSKKVPSADNLEEGLSQFMENEYDLREIQQEVGDFIFAFSRRSSKADKSQTQESRIAKDAGPGVLNSKHIVDLYTHMVEAGVLDRDRLESGEHRYFLPFPIIDPKTKTMSIQVVPFASPDAFKSKEELRNGVFSIRDINDFFQDAKVSPRAFPHIRALIKALFVYIYVQLHSGRRLGFPLEIDFGFAHNLLKSLDFTPGESLRDIFYQDKRGKFIEMMERKGHRLDIPKKNKFQQWMKAEHGDDFHVNVRQIFEWNLEAALSRKVEELKEDITEQFAQMAEMKRAQAVQTGRSESLQVEEAQSEFSGRFEEFLALDLQKSKK